MANCTRTDTSEASAEDEDGSAYVWPSNRTNGSRVGVDAGPAFPCENEQHARVFHGVSTACGGQGTYVKGGGSAMADAAACRGGAEPRRHARRSRQ